MTTGRPVLLTELEWHPEWTAPNYESAEWCTLRGKIYIMRANGLYWITYGLRTHTYLDPLTAQALLFKLTMDTSEGNHDTIGP